MANEVVDNGTAATKATRMASGAVFSFWSIIVLRATAIANSIVIVRALGPSDFGVYSVVILSMSVASILASFGVPPAIVKFLAEQPSDSRRASQLIGAGAVLVGTSTSITTVILAIAAPFLANDIYGEPRLQELLFLALVGLVVTSLVSPFLSVLQGFELIKEMSLRNVTTALISVPSTFFLVSSWGLNGAVLATTVNALAVAAVNCGILRTVWKSRKIVMEMPSAPAVYFKVLGYATPALATGLAVAPILWIVNTLLAAKGSFAELGKYSVALALSSYLLFIPAAIGVPLIPIVSRLDVSKPNEFPPFFIKTLRIGAFALVPPSLVLFAFPEFFATLLYGPLLADAGQVVRILVPAVFLAGISSIVGFVISGTGRMWHGLALNLVWAGAFAVLAFLFVPSGKAFGLALAYLLSYAVHFTVVVAYSKFTWSLELRPLRAPLSLGAIAFCFVELTGIYFADPWRVPVLAGVISLVAAAEVLVMSKREVEVLGEPLRRFLVWVGLSQ